MHHAQACITVSKVLHRKALEIHNRDLPAGPNTSRGGRKHYPMDTFNYLMQLGIDRYNAGHRLHSNDVPVDLSVLEVVKALNEVSLRDVLECNKEAADDQD